MNADFPYFQRVMNMNTRIVLLVAMLSAIAIFFYVDGQQFLSLATLSRC